LTTKKKKKIPNPKNLNLFFLQPPPPSPFGFCRIFPSLAGQETPSTPFPFSFIFSIHQHPAPPRRFPISFFFSRRGPVLLPLRRSPSLSPHSTEASQQKGRRPQPFPSLHSCCSPFPISPSTSVFSSSRPSAAAGHTEQQQPTAGSLSTDPAVAPAPVFPDRLLLYFFQRRRQQPATSSPPSISVADRTNAPSLHRSSNKYRRQPCQICHRSKP